MITLQSDGKKIVEKDLEQSHSQDEGNGGKKNKSNNYGQNAVCLNCFKKTSTNHNFVVVLYSTMGIIVVNVSIRASKDL